MREAGTVGRPSPPPVSGPASSGTATPASAPPAVISKTMFGSWFAELYASASDPAPTVCEKTSQRPKPTTREATVAMAMRTAAPRSVEALRGRRGPGWGWRRGWRWGVAGASVGAGWSAASARGLLRCGRLLRCGQLLRRGGRLVRAAWSNRSNSSKQSNPSSRSGWSPSGRLKGTATRHRRRFGSTPPASSCSIWSCSIRALRPSQVSPCFGTRPHSSRARNGGVAAMTLVKLTFSLAAVSAASTAARPTRPGREAVRRRRHRVPRRGRWHRSRRASRCSPRSSGSSAARHPAPPP